MKGSVVIFGKEFEYDFLSGWVKYIRLQHQYSLEALSYSICSASHLSYFENGKKTLRGEIIEALLKKLNINDILELHDIGLIRQKLNGMMVQIESMNFDSARSIYEELLQYENIIASSPYNIEFKIYQLMFNTFVEEKKYKQLEQDIQNLDRIYSSLNMEHQYLYMLTSGRILFFNKSHKAGIQRFEAAHNLKAAPWIKYCLGFAYCFNNEFLRATSFLKNALESYEKSGRYINAMWCNNYLGICYSSLKIYDLAESHYTAALTGAEHFKMNKIYWNLYNNLSHLYYKKGDYKACLNWLDMASKSDGDQVLTTVNYIETYIKLNRIDKCKELFDCYLTEKYKSSKYYKYLYFLYLSVFHFNEDMFYDDTIRNILPFYENMDLVEICNIIRFKLIEHLENKRKYKEANKIYNILIQQYAF